MDLSKLTGKFCAFSPDPKTKDRYCGQIVAAKPLPPTARGQIPNALLTVRGRTGKTATVNLVEQYASIHDTWGEAQRHS